jgi:hypothetical protein
MLRKRVISTILVGVIGIGFGIVMLRARRTSGVGPDWQPARMRVSERPGSGDVAIPATRRALDGIAQDGALWIATDGGLVEARGGRTITWADGLGATGATALTTFGGRVVAGGDDGSLSIVEPDGVRVVRVDGVRAAIADAVAWRGRIWAATRGDGLLAWDGERVDRALLGADATAIAGGAALAVGTAGGDVLVARDGRFRKVATGDAVTALAWDGPALWIARADAVERLDDGGLHRILPGARVTSLLVAGGELYAASEAGGVIVIGPGGQERDVGHERIARLRLTGGDVLGFGDGYVWRLDDDAARFAAIPSTLASGRIAALARSGDEIWVGTDSGVDVLDEGGRLARHLDVGDVRAFARGPGGMLIATAGGLLDGALRPIEPDGVAAVADLAGQTAIARPGSVAIVGDDRTWPVRARALAWGASGSLFAGGDEGLTRIDDAGDEELVDPHPVAALVQADALWLAGPSRPVARLDGTALVESGPPVDGRALAVLGRRLFTGTGDGVRVLEGDRWRALDVALPSPRVSAVLPTEDALWIGTDRGLLRVERRRVDAALATAPQS